MEYVDSNSRAIIRLTSGVIYFLPVVLNEENEAYVKYFDRYVKPEDVHGYEH
jgi:hypothetical protein